MANDQLLAELQKEGILTEDVVAKIKRDSFLSGRSVEELINSRRLVDDVKIAQLKSALLNVPYQKINFDAVDASLFEIVPEETVRTYGVAPLSKQDNLLVVGMLHPDDLKAQEALKFIARRSRLNLGVYLISYSDWQEILRHYSPYRGEIESAVQALNLKSSDKAQKIIGLEEDMTAGKEDAPIIRIVADTFREAVQSRASDVHIEPQSTYLRIRFRIDGDLREVAALPLEVAQAVVSRVKIISNLKIDESRTPQDGRFRSKVFDREVDFRVATFPTPLGEKTAIRILDPTTGLRNFQDLALLGKNKEIIERGIDKPFGMMLVTGPTGSGKTTTLYALLQELNKESVNIVSLEDPVEYFVSGINQSQVRPEIGYDFASGLRQILRQDPDVIMVGEVRDNDTAGLAIHAALTGHVVLSTLHTNNAIGVIPRLIDMKVEPFLLPSALNVMISQRLVSVLCENCRAPEVAPDAVQELVAKALAETPKELHEKYGKPYKIYHAPGCPKCRGRGVLGRLALFEAFEMTSQLEDIIGSGPTTQKILAESRRQGMLTLRQDGVLKALAGSVSMEEVLRETEDM